MDFADTSVRRTRWPVRPCAAISRGALFSMADMVGLAANTEGGVRFREGANNRWTA